MGACNPRKAIRESVHEIYPAGLEERARTAIRRKRHRVDALPLSYDTHRQPPLSLSLVSLSVGVVAQWQSTGCSSQRPWVWSPAVPPFFLSLCRFKGLRTVTVPIVFNQTITIDLWTVGESRPSYSPCCDHTHHPLWSTIAHSNHPIHFWAFYITHSIIKE